ncbi:MAG: 4-hydroxythreonine-4-phosphate dehydrogenase PdxA [Bacteroidetes bacterium]|nr:4-hydroxythreonine-4-phosphate dehydrogenase PdxA [Bacteroidota bacterium]
MQKPILGISIGDLNGIGPEIIIKTFSDTRMLDFCQPVIFASSKLINTLRKGIPDTPFAFNTIKDFTKLDTKSVHVFSCWEEEVNHQPGQLTELGGKYAVRSLMVAVQCLKDGQIDALVTAPLDKRNTHVQDFNYTGHTPYLKAAFNAKDVLMLLYNDDLRVALATEHVPLAQVSGLITRELLLSKIGLLSTTLKRDFGIDKPKIALLGLNPHAGDDGNIGREDIDLIKPVAEQLQSTGQLVYGPYSADAFFARRTYTHFDGVLAMYHDQGLIPFKTIAGGNGINFTAGLPVIRTSPDHGTAFDIAGKGIADPDSFRQAVFAAIDLLAQRKQYDENTANPLQRSKLAKERY